MVQVTDAIYADGVLKPIEPLGLPENERVRILVQSDRVRDSADRDKALRRLFEGMDKMSFYLTRPLPSREELHDRSI